MQLIFYYSYVLTLFQAQKKKNKKNGTDLIHEHLLITPVPHNPSDNAVAPTEVNSHISANNDLLQENERLRAQLEEMKKKKEKNPNPSPAPLEAILLELKRLNDSVKKQGEQLNIQGSRLDSMESKVDVYFRKSVGVVSQYVAEWVNTLPVMPFHDSIN